MQIFGMSGPWEWVLLLLLVVGGLLYAAKTLLAAVARVARSPKRPTPLPGQRWAIASGPTVEILSIDAEAETLTARFPDGTTQSLPTSALRSGARLLPADEAIPELSGARPGR